VLHSVPGAWREVAAELHPVFSIGHSVWELDDVPTAWIEQMSRVDEFWVPSEWNRDAFARAFDRPVHVVPHVTTAATPEPCPMQIPDDVAVVSMISAWDWRKRPDRAIEAFCHAFAGRRDAVLAIKTTPWDVGWPGGTWNVPELIQRITERFPRPPTIHYSTTHWTDGQMLGLALRSIGSLSLTASEGWGLGAFDAASVGVPVIITGYGGQLEYLGDDYPGLLPYRKVKTSHSDRVLFEPGTEWAHADMDAAVDLLRALVDGSAPELTQRARTLAPEIRERFSPTAVGRRMAELLPGTVRDHPRPSARPRPVTSASDVSAVAFSGESVVVLTPIKDAAHHAPGFVDRILALQHPRSLLRVAVLASDSVDDTPAAFRREFTRLSDVGIAAAVYERNFGYRVPDEVPRWSPEHQLARRIVLARSRNHLLSRALGDADWALWIDADVVEFPTDVIARLISVGGEVVEPRCVRRDGSEFDFNAWTDHGRWHLGDYLGEGLVELHAVGGTMLLVRADRHRDGLIWPSYLHGAGNERTRTDPASIGRDEIGEVETEGLAIMANDMGIACWGLPDLTIVHE
jgi:glycosyltransferase involved in cell wall biosynthesis